MKTIALVPIKMNNERLPNKNTKSFTNGKPLITYILNSLKSAKNIDDIYVYCSNEEIKKFLIDGVKYLKRDKKLDLPTTSINEVLSSFAKEVDSDIYVLAHATAPFITTNSIDKAIESVLFNEYDSALTVLKNQEFYWKDNKPFNYKPDYIPRTQDLPPFYSETSGLYVYDKDTILTKNRRIGENPFLVEVSKIEAIDIDDYEDFLMANAIFNMNKTIVKEFEL